MDTAGKEESIKDAIDKISEEIVSAGGKVETVQKMEKKNFVRVANKKHNGEKKGLLARCTTSPMASATPKAQNPE